MENQTCPVVILAGGRSTRMGADKASLLVAGRPLLQHVVDACTSIASHFTIVTARKQYLPELRCDMPLTAVEDTYENAGPLGGIYTGIQYVAQQPSDTPLPALVVACDMPLLQPALLLALVALAEGHDAAVPMRGGLPEPLCAIYRTTCVTPARHLLERGDYKVSGLLDTVITRRVQPAEWQQFDPQGRSFLNVNHPADLEAVVALLTGTG